MSKVNHKLVGNVSAGHIGGQTVIQTNLGWKSCLGTVSSTEFHWGREPPKFRPEYGRLGPFCL